MKVKAVNKADGSKKFSIKMQKKLVVLYAMSLLMFAGLSVRLIFIMKEDGIRYQKQVFSQQSYTSTTIPYRRGSIVDVKGTRLAVSEKVYNLVIDAKVMTSQVRGEERYLEPTLKALGEHFELDMAQIREYVTNNKTSSWYVPLKRLTYEEISGFQEEQQKEDSLIRGVWFEEEYTRVYPYGSLAADVIGFLGTDNNGMNGLEEYYSDILNGINGREYGYLNDDLALERTVKAAVDGYNIHTTIDANVQMIMEKYLKKFDDEYRDKVRPGNGAENTGAIMMWVNSGEILAMGSYPTFDLNDPRNPDKLLGSELVEEVTNAAGYTEVRKTDINITEEVLAGLDSNQLYLNLNNLWKNFCISEAYEPGSTAKPFTVASALEEGAIAPEDTFVCEGVMEVGGYDIKCHAGPQGVLTLEQAVASSCNVTMMKISEILGKEKFCKFQQVFNFGLKTNIDLTGEARTASLVYSADNMGPTDLVTNSFGQNFNVTMIEMITGFCSLINGGYYYEPHVVNRITNASGATVENIEPRILKQTVSESTSELIRQYCEAVVEYGTGKSVKTPGYVLGGKTGTAETIDPITHKRSETEHVVSVMAYAPADDPQIAIYVVVDRANAERQDVAAMASEIARGILMESLPYLNIFMTEELTEAEIKELQDLHIEIMGQYTKNPEDEGPEDGEESGGSDEGNDNLPEPPWKSWPVNEEGYRVEPGTGKKYDAQTGLPIEGGESVPNTSVPVNPNMINPNLE